MSKLETHHARARWSWVVWITLPWVSFFYAENVSNAPLTFTLRKFVENPAIIGLIGSINVAFNFIVGVVTSYMSDRVWTRWGRRRPFLMIGWSGVAVCMALVPLAPNLGTLVVIIVLYQFFADIAKPLEPLTNEIVPAPQRGRFATIRSMAQNLMNLFFFGVMVAQFDRIYDIDAWGRTVQLRGDVVLYWTGSFLLLIAVAFLAFKVRETPPPGGIVRERLALWPLLRDIFGHRQWWTVYLIYSVPMIGLPGLDTFSPLLQTEQLGFTRAQFGGAASAGMLINLFLFIPLAGFLTDRMPRLLLMQIGVVMHAVVFFIFFLYLRYVADYTISIYTLIGFGIAAVLFKTCAYVVWAPLVYDYIPRDRFGTVSAGFAFVGGIAPFLLINLAGVWVTTYTRIFGARGQGSYDYSSIYVLQMIAALVALGITFHVKREERKGRLIAYGQLEAEERRRAEA